MPLRRGNGTLGAGIRAVIAPSTQQTGMFMLSGEWRVRVTRSYGSPDTERAAGFRLPHESVLAPIEAWSKIIHPNIVHVREAYTTRAFNDNCQPRLFAQLSTCDTDHLPLKALIVAYEYFPRAVTLFDHHIKPKPSAPIPPTRGKAEPVDAIPEGLLWSYIIQIANAMKHVHDRGLALRVLDPTKVLLTGPSR